MHLGQLRDLAEPFLARFEQSPILDCRSEICDQETTVFPCDQPQPDQVGKIGTDLIRIEAVGQDRSGGELTVAGIGESSGHQSFEESPLRICEIHVG